MFGEALVEAAVHEATYTEAQAEMTGMPDILQMEVRCCTQLSSSPQSAERLTGRP